MAGGSSKLPSSFVRANLTANVTHLMKPVSEVMTSPGTTRSFRSDADVDKDTCFRRVGNLMLAAMLAASPCSVLAL